MVSLYKLLSILKADLVKKMQCEYYPLGNVQGQYSTEVGEEVTGNSSLGYGMGGISSTTGYGWLIGIVVGVCANIVFVVMLVWKLS